MSAATYELLETLQADLLAVLQNTPALAGANIIADANGDIESRVTKALGITKESSGGKRGLAIIILLPEVTTAEKNLPGPPLLVKLDVQVIEHVQINRGPSGTALRSSQAALMVLGALHLHTLGAHVTYADANPIEPLPVTTGLVSHAVTLFARANGLQGPGKAGAVHPEISAGLITLTTATEGAAILYTTDGTYPTPTHGTLYSVPFEAPATGTTLRAAADAAALNPGDVCEFTITASATTPEGALTLAGETLTLAGEILTLG